jgi:hypothetical protein
MNLSSGRSHDVFGTLAKAHSPACARGGEPREPKGLQVRLSLGRVGGCAELYMRAERKASRKIHPALPFAQGLKVRRASGRPPETRTLVLCSPHTTLLTSHRPPSRGAAQTVLDPREEQLTTVTRLLFSGHEPAAVEWLVSLATLRALAMADFIGDEAAALAWLAPAIAELTPEMLLAAVRTRVPLPEEADTVQLRDRVSTLDARFFGCAHDFRAYLWLDDVARLGELARLLRDGDQPATLRWLAPSIELALERWGTSVHGAEPTPAAQAQDPEAWTRDMRAWQTSFADWQHQQYAQPQAVRPLNVPVPVIPARSAASLPATPAGTLLLSEPQPMPDWEASRVVTWCAEQARGRSSTRVSRPGVAFQDIDSRSRSRSPLLNLSALTSFPVRSPTPGPTTFVQSCDLRTGSTSSGCGVCTGRSAAATQEPIVLIPPRERSSSPLRHAGRTLSYSSPARVPSPAIVVNRRSRTPALYSELSANADLHVSEGVPVARGDSTFAHETLPDSITVAPNDLPTQSAPSPAFSPIIIQQPPPERILIQDVGVRPRRCRSRSRTPSRSPIRAHRQRSRSPSFRVLCETRRRRVNSPDSRRRSYSPTRRHYDDSPAARGRAGDAVVLADGGRPDIITATAGTVVVRGGRGKPQRPKRARTALASLVSAV